MESSSKDFLDNVLSEPISDTSSFNEQRDCSGLIEEHQSGVWRYLRAIGCDESLADDLTQETFVAVLRRPFQQYTASSTAMYLRRVAFHLLVSYRRRQSRMMVTDELEVLDSQWMRWAGADLSSTGDEMFETLARCFERLTERAQLSLRMRFADNASRESIASALGISEHGAKNLMQRAKSQLKSCMDENLT